jgi:hypothetical protein
VAFGADAVAGFAGEFRGVDDGSFAGLGDVPIAWAVATFAGDAAFQKRLGGEAVFGTCYRLQAAGVTLQAGGGDGAGQFDVRFAGVAGRGVEAAGAGVVGHGRLKQESSAAVEVVAADVARSDEPFDGSLEAEWAALEIEMQSAGRGVYAAGGAGQADGPGCDGLDAPGGVPPAAALGHAGLGVGVENGGVARAAGFATSFAVGLGVEGGDEREQQQLSDYDKLPPR